MRLLIAFDFDDTLACMKSGKNVVAGSINDREGRLTKCQISHKGEKEILIQAMYKSKQINTLQYPLALGMMRNFILALNDNPSIMKHSVFVVVITNGCYLPASIERFFMQAYNASALVAKSIRIVSRHAIFDRGLTHNFVREVALTRFCELLNKPDSRSSNAVDFDLWSRIRPEMVYLFDDMPENLEGAEKKGYIAINSRESAFLKKLVVLANIIRSESFFRGFCNAGYEDVKLLEEQGWTII